jgi:hypothetical protein
MRSACLASLIALCVSVNLRFSATGATGEPAQFACRGTKADAARKVAKDHTWPPGMDPKACFGEMPLTERARKQIVVAVPSPHDSAGQRLNIDDRSRAGPWYALFTQPVCGTSMAVGPKSPDGKSHDHDRGAALHRQGRRIRVIHVTLQARLASLRRVPGADAIGTELA